MAPKLPISTFIIALNEGDRIGTTIESVRGLVDEVIVIDGGSSDDTVSKSQFFGARAMYNPWEGYGPQKRFGEEQCRNEWLMNLDADEALSPELCDEIRALFAAGPQHTAYSMRVCNMLPGEETIPRRTQINTVLRLYNKRKARFSDSPVHDSVIVSEGATGALKGPVYHRSYRSLEHAIDKVNRYSTMQAADMIERGQKVSTLRLIFEIKVAFLKAYFFRGYIFRGTRGFNYAMVYAFSRFARLAKWHEMMHEKDPTA